MLTNHKKTHFPFRLGLGTLTLFLYRNKTCIVLVFHFFCVEFSKNSSIKQIFGFVNITQFLFFALSVCEKTHTHRHTCIDTQTCTEQKKPYE